MARNRTAATSCGGLPREFVVLGIVILSFMTGRPGSADDQASSVFRESEIKAMRTEYEDWLNRIREIPASSLAEWEGARRNYARRPCTVLGWTRCRRRCRST